MECSIIFIISIIISSIISLACAPDHKARRKITDEEILNKILRPNIHKSRPINVNNNSSKEYDDSVVVTVNIFMRNIRNLNDIDMTYSTQITLREEWLDSRLAYKDFWKNTNSTVLPPFVILPSDHKIWMPDTFFQNELEARKHNVDTANQLIRIYPDGKILYSVRQEKFAYPWNSFTTDDVRYLWKETNPVQTKTTLRQSIPSFEVQMVNCEYCNSLTASGEYSCLRVIVMLRRSYSFYIINYFIPDVTLVILSWMSFWIKMKSVGTRLTLPLTILLTITIQAWGVNDLLPKVSYIKAIDVWNGACWAFLFAALLQLMVINYFFQMEETEAEKKHQKNLVTGEQFAGVLVEGPKAPLLRDGNECVPKQVQKCKKTRSLRSISNSQKIELVSRFLFPLCFLIFNVVYWCRYLK